MPVTNPLKGTDLQETTSQPRKTSKSQPTPNEGAPNEAFANVDANQSYLGSNVDAFAPTLTKRSSVAQRMKAAARVTQLLQPKDAYERYSQRRSSTSRKSFLRTADSVESTVHLSIIEAKGLRAMDRGVSSDPFAVVLINGKKEVFRTEIKKKTLRPFWNASCTFHVKPGDTEIRIDFFDDDGWSLKADVLGHATFDFRNFPTPGVEKWFDLASDVGDFKTGSATGSARLRIEFIAATTTALSGSAPYTEWSGTRSTHLRNTLLRETEKITDVIVKRPPIPFQPFGYSLPGGDVEMDIGGLEDLERVTATEENGKTMVTHFSLQKGQKLTGINSMLFSSMPALRILNLSGCCALTSLPGLASLTNLEHLDISKCIQLRQLSSCAWANKTGGAASIPAGTGMGLTPRSPDATTGWMTSRPDVTVGSTALKRPGTAGSTKFRQDAAAGAVMLKRPGTAGRPGTARSMTSKPDATTETTTLKRPGTAGSRTLRADGTAGAMTPKRPGTAGSRTWRPDATAMSTTLKPNATTSSMTLKDEPLCPNLRFLDVHGCAMLPNTEIWPLVAPNIGKVDMKAFNAEWREPLQRQPLSVGCPLGHVLTGLDVGKCTGFRCSLCQVDQAPGSRMRACRGCGFYLCKTCAIQDMGLVVGVVWPSEEASLQAQKEATTMAGISSCQPDNAWLVEVSCRVGLRTKWKAALETLQGSQKVSQEDKENANEVHIKLFDDTADDDNFEVMKDRSCFWGFSDFHIGASDLDECKRSCVARGCGCFVIWQEKAYFKSKDVETCRKNLIITPRATTYLCHAISKKEKVERRRPKRTSHAREEEESRRERERLAKEEAEITSERMDTAGISDAPTFQQFMPLIEQALPSTLCRCPLMGCNASVPISELEAHKAGCDWRLVQCEAGCGAMVPAKMKEHHESVETNLRSAMKTWDVSRLKNCIKKAEGHCAFCRQSEKTLRKARANATKVQKAMANIKRSGAMEIPGISFDLETCTITLENGLPLAKRQPPDDSAAFKEGCEEEALKILKNIATILNSFGICMAMEGHTGDTDPPDFWQSLADNRGAFIVGILEAKFGVPKYRCIPYGKPGGGVIVNIRKAAFKEVFALMDTDKDGMMSLDELVPAKTALLQWFHEHQLDSLFRKFNLQDKVDVRMFCEDCDVDWE